MKRIKSIIGFSSFMFICLLFFGLSSVRAETEAEYIDLGESQLYAKTVDGVTDAYSTFTTALADFPNSAVINTYLAITRLLNFGVSDDTGAFKDFLSDYGFSMSGTDIDTLDISATEDENGDPDIPEGAPSGETIRSFISDSFVSVIDDSIVNLDTAISNWTSSSYYIIAKENLETDADIEFDYGDLYLLRATLKAFKMNLLIASAYDLNIDVKDIVDDIKGNLFSMQGLLDSYTDLLRLLPTATTPGPDGAAQLAEARASLLGFIDDYLDASDNIRNDPGTQSGAEEMIEMEECDLLLEEFFRDNLTAISDSLDQGTTYEYLDNIETWVLTDSVSGAPINIHLMNNRGTGDWNMNWGENYLDGDVKCVTINGDQITIVLEADVLELTYTGTLNVAEDAITDGTYSGWVNGVEASGSFTGERTGTEQETQDVNLNEFFNDQYDLRDYMPEYNLCNEPITGTMGHGLGYDPTLGGLLPDQTHDDYDFESYNSISGTVVDDYGYPVEDLEVIVYSTQCGVDSIMSEYTNINGEYHICGLPAGSFYVKACGTCNDLYYVDEWYNNVASSDCATANAVTVTEGADTPGVDFQLSSTRGYISGSVHDSSDDQVITGISMEVQAYATASSCLLPRGTENMGSAWTDPDDGTFIIKGLPADDYYVRIIDNGGSDYVLEYWSGNDLEDSSSWDCGLAGVITVTENEIAGTSADFYLETGEPISGNVTDGSSGIEGVTVYAYYWASSESCDGANQHYLGSAVTDSNGDYDIPALSASAGIYVRTVSTDVGNYVDEWYDGDTGTVFYNCSDALSVSAGATGIDFALDQGGTISGRVTDSNDWGIESINVLACTGQCDLPPAQTAATDYDGNYTISGLPLGESFYLATHNPGYSYMYEWYDNIDYDTCDGATPVVVTSDTEIYFQLDIDDDGDDMSDEWEETYFGDTGRDGTGDYDEDDLTDLDEFQNGTYPNDSDSEDDGMPDGWEVQYELDPLVNDAADDPDEDGYTNLEEYLKGTDPTDAQSHPVKAMPWVPLLLED